MIEAKKRRPVPVRTDIIHDGAGSIKIDQRPSDGTTIDDLGRALKEACGSQSSRWTKYLLNQMVAFDSCSGEISAVAYDAGVQFLNGIAPSNELEAALAAQMFMVHNATMSMAFKAAQSQQPEMIKLRYDQLNKLSRTFAAQVEALSKLRTGGKQTVNVTHTHIDARGSQNVIAETVTTGGGVSRKSDCQPHAPDIAAVASLAFEPGMPLRSENPSRDTVQSAGCER